jgi:hypothetical protein
MKSQEIPRGEEIVLIQTLQASSWQGNACKTVNADRGPKSSTTFLKKLNAKKNSLN